ncbi:alpha/beta fold hydrolase [Staphylococcus lutrae]|uniref:Alpha/beta hydrolase n=1 Tax=Staphylococcus lutrae TaxID=155085 RepID=A0AAC9RRS1_9STAP|nr:alpha/beta hydrolase [Staphylococcus lutrae]ARJ51163.1 alpha/beta hydrolase [Staphylococcus lutrae]PNZ37911.1 alpha/beta hydrolase [Staphylococcus lutrae]
MQLFKASDGTALNYRSMGKGYPIVMVHSIYMNHTIFEDIAKRLSRYFQVILIDLRGHGYSDKPLQIDFPEYSQDLKELMDFLYIECATVIGIELGSAVALDLVRRAPEKVSELILINPTVEEEVLPDERLFRKYAEKIRTWSEAEQAKYLDKHLYFANGKVRRFLKGVNDSAALLTDFEKTAVEESFTDIDLEGFLPEVHVRTLVIAGVANERVIPNESEYVAQLLPNATYALFKKSGVYPFVEEKEKFLKTVKNFMQRTTHNMDL